MIRKCKNIYKTLLILFVRWVIKIVLFEYFEISLNFWPNIGINSFILHIFVQLISQKRLHILGIKALEIRKFSLKTNQIVDLILQMRNIITLLSESIIRDERSQLGEQMLLLIEEDVRNGL